MQFQPAILSPAKKKKPFIQNGRKDPFIRNNGNSNGANRKHKQEDKADAFAQTVAENAKILNAFLQNKSGRIRAKKNGSDEKSEERGQPLHHNLLEAFKFYLGEDFSDVRIHTDALSTQIAIQYNAAAVTVGFHIYLNENVFDAGSVEGLYLLAHELYHTKDPDQRSKMIEVQLKPLTELNDQTAEQKKALQRAVKIAQGEQGEVDSSATNEDKTRVGWQYLVEYFRTTMGEDTIVANKEDYKPGKFLEENIKYIRRGKATKIKIVDGKHTQVVDDKADLLPSWCGIFAFWAYHKAGIHPPKWELGKANFTSKDQYPKGEYLPRPGDLVIKNGFNHHAMVVRTIPEVITDTKDLGSVRVVTINGNTAGSNHTGGQIQEKTDPYSYWDYYVKPFFAGVMMTPEKDFKVDERLKKSLGEETESSVAASSIKPADLSISQHSSSLQPVGDIGLLKPEDEKKVAPEVVEAPPIDPKKIMAEDPAYKELNTTLKQNAAKEKDHVEPEIKAEEAQRSAVSPKTESLGKAKAKKVTKLAALPRPKDFKAEDLKASILKEVDSLIEKKKEEANDTGNKPKIKDNEIAEVKKVNQADIKKQRTESMGDVEKSHKAPPDESGIEQREAADVIVEDPGKEKRIQETEKAVAKPIADERITLEEDSAKIDNKMAENDVDEKQLEESEEEKFTGALKDKKGSQAQAAAVKEDYRAEETVKLDADKKNTKNSIFYNVDKIHEARKGEFGNVDLVKDKTKSADEAKRKEVTDGIEKIYNDSEISVNAKLAALEASVGIEFDLIMNAANNNFKRNVNNALDDEFTWEWAAKKLDRKDYNSRVKKVFDNESRKYREELSEALNPLTTKIANTLNAILDEIQAAKTAVIVFVDGLDPAMAEIGIQSAKGVLEKFSALEESVNEKQNGLTNNLAQKYADGVMSLEKQFKEIMDSRKSWLEKALDAIIDAIKEIINLFIDLKKALERAAAYGKRIIKAPLKFFGNLVKGATAGFNNFVKNIAKHLLQGALEWVTGEMGDAGIQLPEKFDFKGILSIILQVLGISINNIKEIAKKVIGAKYVALLEKGADLGVKAGDKILQVFNILKKEGISGLWEFIKEQFSDLKEKLMEEAKSFIVLTIVEAAVIKVVSMLIPGAGFISAVKSLIDFLRTLFAKARQIVAIITGIIDTFGEVLEGNVGKVSEKIEWVLAKFLSLAITFLAAILGLGKIGKKINDIIQKKIKDPINKAITKMMEKLKAVMTKLGIFKFLDKAEEKIKKGAKWVDEKKEQVKDKAKEALNKLKGFLKNLTNKYKDENGETHTLKFKDTELYRESVSKTLGNYLSEVRAEIKLIPKKEEKEKHTLSVNKAFGIHRKIVDLIGETVRQSSGKYAGADKGFSPKEGELLRGYLQEIAEILRTLPLKAKKMIPKTKISYKEGVKDGIHASGPLISLDSDEAGSQPAGDNSPLSQSIIDVVLTKKKDHNLVRGHLINHELYGTGVGTKNLAPIPKRANSKMLNSFEKDAKNLVHSNNVVALEVTMNYGPPNDKIAKGASLFAQKLPAGTLIPVNVVYTLNQKEFTGDGRASQATINDSTKWKPSGLSKTDTIPIDHNDFF